MDLLQRLATRFRRMRMLQAIKGCMSLHRQIPGLPVSVRE
jgi:hypothetical protein